MLAFYRVTGNCGKVIAYDTAVYQVINLLLYHLYCLMLNIWGKNIRNKKWTIVFSWKISVCTQMPLYQIRCKLGLYGRISFTPAMNRPLLRLAACLSTVFTSSGKELEEKWKSCINVFFDIFGSWRIWQPGRIDVTGCHESVDNSGEGVTVKKLT